MHRSSLSIFAFAAVAACVGPTAPRGMALAAAAPTAAPGSMLVAFPKSACTGSINAVFLGHDGSFVSSVAPGTAAYVPIPPDARRLFVVPSLDIEGSPGMRFTRYPIAIPSDQAIILDVPRMDARNCWRNAAPRPTVVSVQDALTAAQPLAWLEVEPQEGAHWVAEHHARIAEMLGPRRE